MIQESININPDTAAQNISTITTNTELAPPIKNSKILWAVLFSFFLVVLSAFYYFYYKRIEEIKPEIKQSTNRSLREENITFSSAIDARNSGNLEESKRLYKQVLDNQTLNTRERSIVEINLGSTLMQLAETKEEKQEGFEYLKSVALNEKYDSDIRAHAVQSMAQWYAAANDPEIYNIIFNDEFFKKFGATNQEESLNNLYRYATSLYPLSISLFKSEIWNIQNIHDHPSTSSTSIQDYIKNNVPAIIAETDKDITRIQADGNSIDLNSVYLAKARYLQEIEKITNDQTFGNPEEIFQAALDRSKLYKAYVTQGHILLALSQYYSEKGDEEKASSTLELMLNDPRIMSSNFKNFLVNRSNLPGTPNYTYLIAKSKENIKLKELLLRLGWKLEK